MQNYILTGLFELKKKDELTTFFAFSEGYGREKSRQKHSPIPQSTYLVIYIYIYIYLVYPYNWILDKKSELWNSTTTGSGAVISSL